LPPLPRRNGAFSFANVGTDQQTRLRVLSGYSPAERSWAWHYYASEDEKKSFFNRDAFANARSSIRFFEAFKAKGEWTPEDFIRNDRHFYLPQEMMRKLDLMTMTYSVEGRAPFVAAPVLALAEKLRYSNMVAGPILKTALRAAFADILPGHVIKRPKHGFNVPIDHWFRGRCNDLVEETISPSSALVRHGMLAKGGADAVRRLVADEARLSGHTVLCLVMLNLWLETEAP
jgi:asparagine synthase (glutamine-hydrolysing)